MSHHSKRSFGVLSSISETVPTTEFIVQSGNPIYVSGIYITRNGTVTVDTEGDGNAIVQMKDSSDNVLGVLVVQTFENSRSSLVLDTPFYASRGLKFVIFSGNDITVTVYHSHEGA